MKKVQQILLTILLLITQFAFARNEISFEKELNIDVSNSSNIFIDIGAGSLKLRGANVDEISVTAKIYSKEYSSLEKLKTVFNDKMELSLVHKNSTVILKSLNKKNQFSFSNPNISVDLDVLIPKGLKVEIDDGSGSMTIADINNSLEIDDGSGSITIKNIVGNVLIDVCCGNSNLTNIDGNVTIDDGSGTININHVSGDISIDDGSGSIIINNLQGKFNLEDDGSGSIRVNGKLWNKY
jgi:DUF4097 and DUF4098 domain-containing protein YvlB